MFKSRRGAFGWIARLLSTLGLLKVIGYLPATWTTPMTFTARRPAKGSRDGDALGPRDITRSGIP